VWDVAVVQLWLEAWEVGAGQADAGVLQEVDREVKPKPILILGDTPDRFGGLSRVVRDIAGQLSRSPRFRVATLGREGVGSRHLPFQQYSIRLLQGGEFGNYDIQKVWADFAGRERGIVLTIYDPTRTLWLSRPEFSGDPDLTTWLQQDHFDLWGYVTLDATGPQDKLSVLQRESLLGYRRLLAYTKWGSGLIERSLGQGEARKRHLDWLPHGLDLPKWPLRDKEEARARLHPFLHEGDVLVGAIGTNQPRKDWGLVASVCQLMASRNPRARFWWHTDLVERSWSLNALLTDFGLGGCTTVTADLTQEQLSWWLNACDLTLHPGLGEGFGYPIFESLASGTPVVHGDYGGGADVLRQCGWESMLVPPQAYRMEGTACQVRPVFDPGAWLDLAVTQLEPVDREALRASVSYLDWTNLWPQWLKWFEEGL